MISLEHAIPYVPSMQVHPSQGKKISATDRRAADLQNARPQDDLNRAVSFRVPTDQLGFTGRGNETTFRRVDNDSDELFERKQHLRRIRRNKSPSLSGNTSSCTDKEMDGSSKSDVSTSSIRVIDSGSQERPITIDDDNEETGLGFDQRIPISLRQSETMTVRDSPPPNDEIPVSIEQTSPAGDVFSGDNMDGVEYHERPCFDRRQSSAHTAATHPDAASGSSLEHSPDQAMQRRDVPSDLTRARQRDGGLGRNDSRYTASSHSGDSERESFEVAPSIDTALTSPEPSARSRPNRVRDRLIRSSSVRENPMPKESRTKPKSESQAHSAPMWPYDRIAGCRISKGRKYLEVVWPNTFVPVEEVEGVVEEWTKHRKMARQEQGKQRHQERLYRRQRVSQKRISQKEGRRS